MALAAEVAVLEHPLLKVPYEQLVKTFKAAQRLLETELKATSDRIKTLKSSKALTRTTARQELHELIARLQALKQQLQDHFETERAVLDRCHERITHLKSSQEPRADNPESEWRLQRIDRILVDYLLREGFYDTAVQLADDSQIRPLVNVELFTVSRTVEQALSQKDLGPALAWCDENSARLKKLKSTFEFKLRLQQFIELFKEGEIMKAVAHANQYFPEFSDRHLPDIQGAMCLLVFPNIRESNAKSEKHQKLLADDRWEELVMQFRRNNFVLNSLTTQSLLSITLQAGLSAMKTNQCYLPSAKNKNCPVCSEHLNRLARTLPNAHHINSTIVCRLTGSVMNEDNPPMVLPNGQVYSFNGLVAISSELGKIKCPVTGAEFQLKDMKKVFVM